MILIRGERHEDISHIRAVIERAFGKRLEADLVDELRAGCKEFLSLVAIRDGELRGHVLFTPAGIDTGVKEIRGMGLAPVAVQPEFQRQGIGSALIREGLRILKDRNCPFVIVLGHPEYYPRFGFEPASKFGLQPQWEGIPDEAFMALILNSAVMRGVTGVARFRDEFDAAV